MTDIPSIPDWLTQLQAGDANAIQKVWAVFAEKLLSVATSSLQVSTRGHVTDGEDILVSVFESVWEASRKGRLKDLKNIDELLWLLLAMTRRKCIDHTRHNNAIRRGGGRQIYSLSDAEAFFAEIVTIPPDPRYAIDLNEHYLWILEQLPGKILKEIAVRRIEGDSTDEIAADLQIAPSTVQRKLKIIRRIFKENLENG